MNKAINRPLLSLPLCLVLGITLSCNAQANTPSPEQRELFRSTYALMKRGKTDEARPHFGALTGYPLYPWLEYEFLTRNNQETTDLTLLDFTARNPGSVMGDSLYERLASRMVVKQEWDRILATLPDHTPLTSLQCIRLEAAINRDKTESGDAGTALQQAKQFWSEADAALPAECDGMLALLEQNRLLTQEDYWQHIGLLMRNNQVTAARNLTGKLPAADQPLVDLWTSVRSDPRRNLEKAFKQTESARLREIIVYGIQRAADKKLDTALPLWDKARKTFSFTPAEKGQVESNFGMWEAWRHDDRGLRRLEAIESQYRTTDGNIWMARLALRSSKWQSVLDAITALENNPDTDDEEAGRDIWQYWKARALTALGRSEEAGKTYEALARDTTFYGFLAADRLGQDYARLKEPPPDRSQRIAGLKKLAAIQRWQEWIALGEHDMARKEWFRLLHEMDKEGMLAAAELAGSTGDANLAIWTVSRTRDWNVVDLRFPMLYTDLIMEQSRAQGIRPEWILGIMRRESAFNADAESSAKALGLMQLMPATARHVGKRLGIPVAGREDILKPETNVQLGSAYLSQMLNRFGGNYAQATAAYNAGPGRIPQWAPDKTIDADQWVESIPYRETRRYVRAVMAYTTIYEHKLQPGTDNKLSSHLKPVHPE
ncbi:MAG: lytic transglycosylase domain-containing protein [Thiothrix sp.]|nr:lytic transglycosylase domain-containing protein [Thiothrix sp.]HPE58956.1 transglycosylase SLT domain-containing protein [Thiolinea sp.]